MKIKLNKNLKFIDKTYEKHMRLNINITCDFQDEKILSHIDNILSQLQFNNFKNEDIYKQEQEHIKSQEKQNEIYKKNLEKKNKAILQSKIKEEERKKKESEKLLKKYN